MASPFDVLGIDPDADDETVEDAYRARVKEAHPDHGGSVREFQTVRNAYERIQAGYDAADHAEETADPEVPEEEEEAGTLEPDQTRIHYLDYEVLQEEGWQLTDEDLFEKAAEAGLGSEEFGTFVIEPKQTLLEAAEENGLVWPYACRGGACTNCAVAIIEGEMPMSSNHILPSSMTDRGIRLSCLTAPTSQEAKIVFNVKHLPGLDDLRLPLSRFNRAELDD
ncbi:2Fe-2S iron-sulfur cluster-binding protein [Salinirubellus salinus]|uniref:2Fe-2S iron-sulfur cluster-binding protein n=1 Tax=Salinirubellus salinus TaxID=1364945 RepID=A0A9E7R3D2_9EURY|nr:ferredoxin Fer [Salinirubellus salinus]UWM54632.1 2Fe-2S iron-sulfur cluster-binding protein [Salinirubellus salinus]UWM54703.1 2Fe-2S iron-sulfur cluster-binding protein [Salinirubellus salinus]